MALAGGVYYFERRTQKRRNIYWLIENCYSAHPLSPSRRLHEIGDSAYGGTVTLMNDRESPFQKGRYSDDIRMLRENFILEEVARRGQFRVYRLSNGP